MRWSDASLVSPHIAPNHISLAPSRLTTDVASADRTSHIRSHFLVSTGNSIPAAMWSNDQVRLTSHYVLHRVSIAMTQNHFVGMQRPIYNERSTKRLSPLQLSTAKLSSHNPFHRPHSVASFPSTHFIVVISLSPSLQAYLAITISLSPPCRPLIVVEF